MRYRSHSRWTLVALACGCAILLGAVLSHSTSLAYTTSPLVAVTPSPTLVVTATPAPKPTPTVVIISQPTSFLNPSSVIAFIGLVVQAVTLFFVIKYVRDTATMAKATQDSANATQTSASAAERTLQEMKDARDEESAPFVIVYFNYIHRRGTIYLVVENIGKSVARDVKLNFLPELQVSQVSKKRIENNALLNNGIKSIVPGYKIPIPFDYLMHYFRENLPTGYTIKVSYMGKKSLPEPPLEYDLDLSIFQVIDFLTEKGLIDVDDTLNTFANNFFLFLEDFKSIHQNLNEISNALNRGALFRNYLQINRTDLDVLTKLKEFVLIWTLDYGKDYEKLNKQFLFDLRNKCLLLKEGLLNNIANSDLGEWQEEVKSIIMKISKLGYMRLGLDGYVVAHSIQGHSIEDFNSLGDSIIEDIKRLIKLIEEENELSLQDSKQEETDLPSSVNETDVSKEDA